ncbi:MAG: DUF4974 domain-containing protein [Muribaculaceae bacterium]|nr:DUF4974 domain-containing protein [Muribaculaceae bacterium]MDE6753147.1 DUF4974 domain-containing protein [Muribaculaceae bacterium]
MDNYDSKYDVVLDIIEHPGNYTPEQLDNIFSDSETREIYNLICKADSAIESNRKIDVEAEWKIFSRKNSLRRSIPFMRFNSRAASIWLIISSSVVAVAAGIAITVSVADQKSAPDVKDEVALHSPSASNEEEKTVTEADSMKIDMEPVIFEDETLETIMKKIATNYGISIKFNNKEAATLHLYYKFDPALPLDEVIGQLNMFEQINIRQSGDTLTID